MEAQFVTVYGAEQAAAIRRKAETEPLAVEDPDRREQYTQAILDGIGGAG